MKRDVVVLSDSVLFDRTLHFAIAARCCRRRRRRSVRALRRAPPTFSLSDLSLYRLERSLCGTQTQRVKEFANQPRTTNRQRILKIASLSPNTSRRPSEKH